jgi:predicted nucleic acid-binding protein
MPGLILDSSGWFAAMSTRDTGHTVAKKAYASAASSGVELVSTTLVSAEVHTLVLRWRGPEAGLHENDLDATRIAPISRGSRVEARP